MSLVVIGPIDATRTNDADRRAVFLHRADLHRRGVRAQHVRRAIIAFGTVGIERVHFSPRRGVTRNIQRIKVIPIGFDLRAFGHRKPHVCKDRRDLFGHLRDRVNAALAARSARQGHVQPFGFQPLFQSGIGQRSLFGGQRRVDLVFQRIEFWPHDLTLFRGHFPQLAHFQGNFAFFTHCLYAQLFDCGLIRSICNQTDIFVSEIVHRGLQICCPLLTSHAQRCKNVGSTCPMTKCICGSQRI